MPGAAPTSGPPTALQNKLFFIDMRRAYAILDKGEIRVTRSGLSGGSFAADQTAFRFVHRVDGQPYEENPSSPTIAPTSETYANSAYVYTGAITGATSP